MIKRIKNISGQTKQILNRDVANGETYDIPTNQWLELANNQEIVNWLENGIISINSGAADLSIEEGITLIKRFNEPKPELAKRVIGENYSISQNEEMILSDMIDITEDGCIDVNGLLTILGV